MGTVDKATSFGLRNGVRNFTSSSAKDFAGM